MKPVQLPVTHRGCSHGGSQPLRYVDCDIHPQRYGILGPRRKFLYEIEESVWDIFGNNRALTMPDEE